MNVLSAFYITVAVAPGASRSTWGQCGTPGKSYSLLFPKDYAENRKVPSFMICSWLYFNLLMLVEERYVFAGVIRPVCLRRLGSIPSSGVKLFLPL